MQVVSNTPQTFLYNQESGLAAALSALQNEQIAKAVADNPKRLVGIATLPMQAPELAAAELRRAMGTLGLKGAQIGSNINGSNLDDPALEPLWAAANELDAFIMVHPTGVAGAERLKSYYLVNLIGNPLDTTIAAAALVFGGVIERYPRIKFLMVHGGGFVPYQAGRFNHGWQVRAEPRVRLKVPPEASLDGSCSTPSCTGGRRWSSWCPRAEPAACCWGATIPSTWERSNARGRSGAVDCGSGQGNDPRRRRGEAARPHLG